MTEPSSISPSDQSKKETTWAMFCHLSALAFCLGIPFGNILGPLIIWLIQRKEMPLVEEHGKESVNFQISMIIYAIIAAILIFIVIGVFLLWALIIADIVLVIIAAIKTSNGEKYLYPFNLRLIK